MSTSDQVLPCIQEPENPEDKNAITLMNKEKIVGHVSKNISIWMAMLLKLKNSSIASRVTGGKVNRGGGYRLEIPCKYLVEGETRAVDWFPQKVEKEKHYVKIYSPSTKNENIKKRKSLRH